MIMKTIEFFQARPVGENKGNYALNRLDVAEFLVSKIYLPEYRSDKGEDFDGEAKILSVSEFGNGVLAKVNVSEWVLDSILGSSGELRTLKVEGMEYYRKPFQSNWTRLDSQNY